MPAVPSSWYGVETTDLRRPPGLRKNAHRRSESMSELPEKIVLATDGSEDAALAARITADLSTRTGAQLHVMHAWHTVPSTRFESFVRGQLHQEAQQLLAEQVGRIKDGGGDVA